MYLVISKCVTAVKVSNFSGHYLRNRSTSDIGVLGYIGIVQHKEHSPEVLSIPPGTPCIKRFREMDPNRLLLLLLLLVLAWRYNSGRVLAFSTIPFHLRRSWTSSVHSMSFIFFTSFLTSSHRHLGLPTALLVNGFHLYIFVTILVSGILLMCPNQLSLWALT